MWTDKKYKEGLQTVVETFAKAAEWRFKEKIASAIPLEVLGSGELSKRRNHHVLMLYYKRLCLKPPRKIVNFRPLSVLYLLINYNSYSFQIYIIRKIS